MHANPQTISWFSPGTKVPLPLKNTPPRNNRNIVESGVKHHKPTQTNQTISTITENCI
jgi:hypothetical protein